MLWVAAVLSVAWVIHYWLMKPFQAKHDFWTLVRQYPDLAQAWFEQDDCWQIFLTEPPGGYRTIVPEALFAGPFDVVVRDKASGNQQRAVVFCAHKELTASQAHFPRFIASVIGQYPQPQRIQMSWVLGSATTAALIVWLFTPSDRDRWVIRDGTPACTAESELEDIQTASPSGRHYEIEEMVTKGACFVLFANERVRLEKLSTDGSRALTFTMQHPKPQWLVANDLRKTNSGWLALPWWPTVTIADEAKPAAGPIPAAAAEHVPPLFNADGTCKDWSHALQHGYFAECKRRQASSDASAKPIRNAKTRTAEERQSNFVSLKLPRGVEVQIPRGWWLLRSEHLRLIATTVEAAMDLSGMTLPEGEETTLIAANSLPKTTYAAIRINSSTPPSMTPAEVATITSAEVAEMGREIQQNLQKSLPAQGNELLEFLGTRIDKISGYLATVTEYRRSGPQGPVWVQLTQVYAERQELGINLSYRESEATLWKPVILRIRQSILIKAWSNKS